LPFGLTAFAPPQPACARAKHRLLYVVDELLKNSIRHTECNVRRRADGDGEFSAGLGDLICLRVSGCVARKGELLCWAFARAPGRQYRRVPFLSRGRRRRSDAAGDACCGELACSLPPCFADHLLEPVSRDRRFERGPAHGAASWCARHGQAALMSATGARAGRPAAGGGGGGAATLRPLKQLRLRYSGGCSCPTVGNPERPAVHRVARCTRTRHHFLADVPDVCPLLCYNSYQQRWVYVTCGLTPTRRPAGSGRQQSREETPPAAGASDTLQQQALGLKRTAAVEEPSSGQIAASGQSDSVRMNRSDDPKKCRDQAYRRPYRGHLLSCLRLNYPDFAYVLWTDDDAAAFLADKFPVHSAMFSGYAKALQRSDALRYFILSYFGGIYADMDVQCLRPFNRLAAAESCFLDQERWEQSQILHGTEFAAMNSVMGCGKRHPFFDVVIARLKRTSKGLTTGAESQTHL
uniref:Alpha-1,4-N-acetylglucosaminyltransferase n=1 Tax=Macrostomum lignano TaxID=282301 RepID=A0A1I8FSH5_9PLAT